VYKAETLYRQGQIQNMNAEGPIWGRGRTGGLTNGSHSGRSKSTAPGGDLSRILTVFAFLTDNVAFNLHNNSLTSDAMAVES